MNLSVQSTSAFIEQKEERIKIYTERQFDQIEQLKKLSEEQRLEMRVVASVLPFRINQYVIEQLINWDNIPADPLFQLTFPQKGMLSTEHYEEVAKAIRDGVDKSVLQAKIRNIRSQLNPHPAGQQSLNVPKMDDQALDGIQHKYRETVLFFPSQGQTCHSYCTFCFRWAQFIGDKDLRFSAKEVGKLHLYLKSHLQVSDLLITGGDPMVMKTNHLEKYLLPLIQPEFNHIQTIRIGSKSLTFWPQRFVSDKDAGDLLRLIERLVKSGKHVAFMAHFNHWREMETEICKLAIKRILATGAVIRTQAPLLANINDNADVWATMWRKQVQLGLIPYYMFVERDTGAKRYFEVPLYKALNIYRQAVQKVSGLGRTARGPSMSAGPGKVEVQGVAEIQGEKVFVLRFLQGRNSDWVNRPFFAQYDETVTWLDQLKPAFGEKKFFFEDEYREMCATGINKKMVQYAKVEFVTR